MPLIARGLFALCLGAVLLAAPSADARRPKHRTARKHVPPIAFYLADDVQGATRAQAITRCKAQHAALRKKYPDTSQFDPALCTTRVLAVRGPYDRSGAKDAEDRSIFVYKGTDGEWRDSDGETSCFAVGTKVSTPEGDKAIESMRPGDPLYAWDPDGGRVVVGRVTHVKRRVDRLVGTLAFDDGTSIEATANHPFYAVAGRTWVEAGKLAPGDRVLKLDGGALREARLVTKTPFERVTDVFDLTVSPHHDFFAAGVLVHNY